MGGDGATRHTWRADQVPGFPQPRQLLGGNSGQLLPCCLITHLSLSQSLRPLLYCAELHHGVETERLVPYLEGTVWVPAFVVVACYVVPRACCIVGSA